MVFRYYRMIVQLLCNNLINMKQEHFSIFNILLAYSKVM